MSSTRFSVVVARPGCTTVALGPYMIRDVADLTAWNLAHHLRREADAQVEVEPYDETLTHLPLLPTTPRGLAAILASEPATTNQLDVHARLTAQVGAREARVLMAEAHMRCAANLWADLAA